MKFKKLLVPAFILSALPVYANAVIVEGSFNGTVIEYADNLNNVWSGQANAGDAFSGSFWYDTAALPTNLGDSENVNYHTYENTWFQLFFNIDGKSFDISSAAIAPNLTGDDDEEGLALSDISPTSKSFSVYDRDDEFNSISTTTTEITQSLGWANVIGILTNLQNDIALDQSFTWSRDADSANNGNAYFSYFTGISENGAVTALQQAYAQMSIDAMTVQRSPNVNPVPVPASLWLFGTALIAFGSIRRRLKNKSRI